MENKVQAKKWFRDLFQGCYLKRLDKYPGWSFWVYDKNLVRLKKLAKITGVEKYNLDMSEGEIIFQQDEKSCDFYIKYTNYWTFLELNFNFNYDEIKELTSSVVNEVLNSKQYTTYHQRMQRQNEVNEVLNSKQYTTFRSLIYSV
jgi:hypothetical protein